MGVIGLPEVPGKTFEVLVHWDAEARVWWAQSETIPGLHAEADTLEELVSTVLELAPELLAMNLGLHPGKIGIAFAADRFEEVAGR